MARSSATRMFPSDLLGADKLSPIIAPMLTKPACREKAESHWRHSIRKHGLVEAIRRLQKVEADTVENLESLFWAHLEEKGESE